MTPEAQKRISKKLSYILRHHPEDIGLEVDNGGWANVDKLLRQLAEHQFPVSVEELAIVVAENLKQRFLLSPDGTRIRANQGHSIPVTLGLDPVTPPETLFHGTAIQNLEAIRKEGLTKQTRNHVHLSTDFPTAKMVGQRHGKAIVLTVQAKAMQTDGHAFFISENGVWLTDSVPIAYLTFPE